MAGKHVGKDPALRKADVPAPEKQHIQSAEELFGIVNAAGLGIGVIHQPKGK